MNVIQISVFLENRAGQLSNITKVLSENNIDLRAINIAETQDYGVLRIIPADAQKASAVLLENGFIMAMTPVIAVAVPDRPGGLNSLLEALAEKEIGIEYMYSVFSSNSGESIMVLQVGEAEKVSALLSEKGFKVSSIEEIK
ncbi:MAG: ACT domain-containing protein [Clostridia bacterium]|nr:ACT domain-containing protein [Clostridia bacterium]MBQ6601420.1 ACT domain-containing protein [Clostridia bacterium]